MKNRIDLMALFFLAILLFFMSAIAAQAQDATYTLRDLGEQRISCPDGDSGECLVTISTSFKNATTLLASSVKATDTKSVGEAIVIAKGVNSPSPIEIVIEPSDSGYTLRSGGDSTQVFPNMTELRKELIKAIREQMQ